MLGDGAVALYPAEGLRDELVGLRLEESSGGSWSFDSAVGSHDDMAVVVALLCVAALGSTRAVQARATSRAAEIAVLHGSAVGRARPRGRGSFGKK